jgi:hypothetical protein
MRVQQQQHGPLQAQAAAQVQGRARRAAAGGSRQVTAGRVHSPVLQGYRWQGHLRALRVLQGLGWAAHLQGWLVVAQEGRWA